MREERERRARVYRRRKALKTLGDVAANSSVALGGLFLLDQSAGLGIGTPGGGTGALAAAAMIVLGLAQIMIPAKVKKAPRPEPVPATPIQAEIERDLVLLGSSAHSF